MGACSSKPRTAEDKPQESTDLQPELPDEDNFGLGTLFSVIGHLGEGNCADTWLMREIATQELVAVKLIPRPIRRPLRRMILQEIKIQRDLGEGHINIVNFKEVILTPSHLALVLEYVPGGTLAKYVSDKWKTSKERNGLFLTEEEARFILKQFLSAVEFIHNHKVAHRDLKLDNTLIDDNDPPLIKICDFGFSKVFGSKSKMHSQIGTPVYMSPQLIGARHGKMGYSGKKADVWATGVLLFAMLLGMFPYEHSEHPDPNTSEAQIDVWLQQVKTKWRENGHVREAAKCLSAECQDLLDHMFDLDEQRRLSIENIRSHPWFSLPMSPKHEAAWKECQKVQDYLSAESTKHMSYTNYEREQPLNDLISKSSSLGQEGAEVERLPMSRFSKSCKLSQAMV